MYKYEEALEECLEYFGDNLPATVFLDKYALRNTNNELVETHPKQLWRRIAQELWRIEKNKFKNPIPYNELYALLEDFRYIIPQGGILYGLGNDYQYVTLSNCYVLPAPEQGGDSYGGIHFIDECITQISKRRGGTGTDISNLRPAGAPTKNSSRTSSGAVEFAKRFSRSIREVGQSGRRGALLLSMNVHHPDISTFIHCKQDLTINTGFNMSVGMTDEFMNAVEDSSIYQQRWPVNEQKPKIQNNVEATTIWKELIHNAWQHGEPGLQFVDTIRKYNLNDCYESLGWKTVGSNPCGEQLMEAAGSCLLLLLNMLSYVEQPFTSEAYFNKKKFYEHAQIAQRLLDDLSDIEIEKIDKIIDKIKNQDQEPDYLKAHELRIWENIRQRRIDGRRTGLGFTALADTLAALNIKYGSDQSIEFAGLVTKILKFGAYRASVDMAKELGSFPIWDAELENNNPFLLRFKTEDIELEPGTFIEGMDIYNDMQEYGRRNISCLTVSPAGTVSIIACTLTKRHGVSSGLEPVFKLSYQRRKKGNPNDENFRIDFVDKTGDSWMHFDVHHPPLIDWAEINNTTVDDSNHPWGKSCANEIDWIQRVKLQAAIQQHIDSSISSTINLPSDVKEDVVSELYITAWKSGLKGVTVYREGSRDGVLIDKAEKQTNIQKRPRELPCDVHHVTVCGQQYFVLVGKQEDQPYEVFAGKNGFLPKKIKSGKIIRKRKNYYKAVFDDSDEELTPITAAADENEETISRLTSALLRSKADMDLIVSQLEKVGGDSGNIHSFAKAIARVLKKYIKDGEQSGEECPECSQKLVRQEGCLLCKACGWSKC